MGIEWPARQPDRHAPVPLYARIKRPIKQQTRLREWLPGEKLPSENELVKQFRVSRMTVNRALRELTQEGLLSRARGLGTFVAASPGHVSLIKLQDIAKETDAGTVPAVGSKNLESRPGRHAGHHDLPEQSI